MLIWDLLIASCFMLHGLTKPVDIGLDTGSRRSDLAVEQPIRHLQRRDADVPFDLSFQAKGQTLFSGAWKSFDGQSVRLSLKCIDCRTWGKVDASATFPDNFGELLGAFSDGNPLNDIDLSVHFKGVRAFFNVEVDAALNGSIKIPLIQTKDPLAIVLPDSQLGVVFSVDLVMGLSGEVQAGAGFQVSVPDTASFTLPLDPGKDAIANFNGVATNLLPVIANVPANMTIALQLGVQAGVKLAAGPALDATALVGAFINMPEITIGEQFSPNQTCLPTFAEIDINAGVFVDIGAEIGPVGLPGINPTAATTFFSAATSTCFNRGASLPVMTDGSGCSTGVVSQTNTARSTQSLIACAVSAINCPASLTQTVLVQVPHVITTSSCRVGDGGSTTTVPNTTSLGNIVTLSSLHTPVTSILHMSSAVTAPVRTVTASADSSYTAASGLGTVGPIRTGTISNCGTGRPTGPAGGSLHGRYGGW